MLEDTVCRGNAFRVAGTLGWAQGRVLAGVISGAGGSPGGNLLTGIPAGVVDWDSLGRGNASGVAGTLG